MSLRAKRLLAQQIQIKLLLSSSHHIVARQLLFLTSMPPLALLLTHQIDDFIFYGAILLVGLMLLNAAWVGYMFITKEFSQIWTLYLLRFLAGFLFLFVFVLFGCIFYHFFLMNE
jgi:hypothetical protein